MKTVLPESPSEDKDTNITRANPVDRLEFAGAAGDGNVYSASFDESAGTWSSWNPLGQPFQPQPMYLYSAAQLSVDGTLDLGNQLPLALDGNSAFSLGGWIRVLAHMATATILEKGTEFSLGFNGLQQLSAQLGASTPLRADVNLELDMWNYVLVTFTPSGNNDHTGNLALYVNGDNVGPAATQTGIASTSASFIIGGQLHAQFSSFSLWSTCLDGAALAPRWDPVSSDEDGVVASLVHARSGGRPFGPSKSGHVLVERRRDRVDGSFPAPRWEFLRAAERARWSQPR